MYVAILSGQWGWHVERVYRDSTGRYLVLQPVNQRIMLVQPIMSKHYRVAGIEVGYVETNLLGFFQWRKIQNQIDFLIYKSRASAIQE